MPVHIPCIDMQVCVTAMDMLTAMTWYTWLHLALNLHASTVDTGMPMGAPPAGPPPMGPPPGGPPDAKRQRREGLVLEPEEEFLQKYPGPSKVSLCAKIVF